MAPPSTSFLFSRRARTSLALLPLLASLAAACVDGNDTPAAPGAGGGSGGAGGAGGVHTGGAPDHDRDEGAISLDETKLRATLVGGSLSIVATVTSGAKAASGRLHFAVLTVDGQSTVSRSDADYTLPAGSSQDFVVSAKVPDDVALQADWARYVLRVTDDAPGTLRATRSLSELLPRYELAVSGPASVVTKKTASYRVRARDARTKAPLANTPVELVLKKGGATVTTYPGTTGDNGEALFDVVLTGADVDQVGAHTKLAGTTSDLASPLAVHVPGAKLLLTTDKPIYQPGQTIHLRALALGENDNHPLAAQPATFEVEDGKGNKIFKKSDTTDPFGAVSVDFAIGGVVNMGDFKVRVLLGDQKSEKTVSVSRYALPKFKIGVQTDKTWYRPGDTLTGVLDVNYLFGKPVSGGDVLVEGTTLDVGQTVFQTVQGKTDASGKASFSLKLPSTLAGLPIADGNAAVDLRVTVTDTAQQQGKQERMVTVSRDGATLVVVPDSTVLVPGLENHLDAFASDPLGAPVAQTPLSLTFGDGTESACVTDAGGHCSFSFTPTDGVAGSVHAVLGGPGGVAKDFSFSSQSGSSHVVVRTDKAVYQTGDTVSVDIVSTDPTSTVYVDWINEGQTVDMRTLDAQSGTASFTQTIDATLAGSNRIEAYVVDPAGNIVRSGRTVFARNKGALNVAVTTDQPQYAPGDPAKVTFTVTDETAAPALASLGIQIVDEAVYALVDTKPGLLRTYFELEDMFAVPSYEVEGPSVDFSDLLFGATASKDPATVQAAQLKAAASFAALGDKIPTGVQLSSLDTLPTEMATVLAPYVAGQRAMMIPVVTAATKDAKAYLSSLGCSASQYYCQKLQKDYVQALQDWIAATVQFYDGWGNAYVVDPGGWGGPSLRSYGPDETPGSSDDYSIVFSWSDLGVPDVTGALPGESGAGGSLTNGGDGTGTGGSGVAHGGATGEPPGAAGAGPRIRKDFPETLYVNPSLVTGADGTATVSVPMADSITTWRVTSLANAQNGKLGGATAGITVFQDFFVDVDFPATLTRGDEVTFPIAVYNYLQTPQTVTLSVDPAPWYTALGPTTVKLTLAPGEVQGAQMPVHVNDVGVKTLTVKAVGQQKSDAVARVVTVVPDGKEIAAAHSGSLSPGTDSASVSYPSDAVPGSPHLHLDVYPAYLSQVVSGMDSILREPTGCFEQTTSSTWPNVLVETYMKKTGQITPALQLKADSLISAGYQRLLTFEHPGGGFSWFGTQDPAPFLSVTAFGVMEFADMKTVHDIDPAMLARTMTWLSSQQQADGSWNGDMSEFFSFQTSTLRNTAFVTWALSAAGATDASVGKGVGYVEANFGSGDHDAYTLGVVANALVLAAPTDALTTMVLDRIEATKVTDAAGAHLDTTGTQTDMYGAGVDADVTATALAVQALILAGGHGETVNGMLSYIAASRDASGNFGSTQATVWSLRALVLAAEKGTDAAIGTLAVSVDGTPFSTVALTKDQSDVMHTVDMTSLATTGAHSIGLTFVGNGKVGYNLVAKHNLPWTDAPAGDGPLSITVGYDKTTLYVDDTVTETVTITNLTDSTENMILATLGVPPGFAVVGQDFDPYLKAGTLSAFETTGKQLILYVPRLAPKGMQTLSFHLTATMPVKAEDGGATVYPYYQPSKKTTAASVSLTASAK